MEIAIITLPLLNNYGGNLQNFALQKTLAKLGHKSTTIDFLRVPTCSFWRQICSWIKTVLFIFIGKRRPFYRYSYKGARKQVSQIFLDRCICKTEKCYKYYAKQLKNFDVVIVGSDQVWRPKYNYRITNMFLDFCKNRKNLKRVAYAASFGVDNWEYTAKQTKECSVLAQKFDAISVREESGVKMCKEHLKMNATWVLDPTLLLTKEDYCEVCKDVPIAKKKFLAAYILNKNDVVCSQCESIAAERDLSIIFFEANSCAMLTVPEWLAMFRDASYVVTDSFHGTVFSILFGKEFKCLYNKSRGSARFDSLLKLYESGKLAEMREFSLNWLKTALEK